jgi:hypothetical protein
MTRPVSLARWRGSWHRSAEMRCWIGGAAATLPAAQRRSDPRGRSSLESGQCEGRLRGLCSDEFTRTGLPARARRHGDYSTAEPLGLTRYSTRSCFCWSSSGTSCDRSTPPSGSQLRDMAQRQRATDHGLAGRRCRRRPYHARPRRQQPERAVGVTSRGGHLLVGGLFVFFVADVLEALAVECVEVDAVGLVGQKEIEDRPDEGQAAVLAREITLVRRLTSPSDAAGE